MDDARLWFAVAFGVSAALILPIGYFAWLFVMYRRPPVRGRAVVTEYAPPGGIAPAEAAYLLDGTLKPRAIAATLVDLHLRGVIRIEGDRKVMGLALLTHGETEEYEDVIIDVIFAGDERVSLDDADDRVTAGAAHITTALRSSLRDEGIAMSGVDPNKVILMGSAVIAAAIVHLRAWPIVGGSSALVSFLVYVFFLELAYIASTWRPRLTTKGRDVTWRLLGFRRYLTSAEAGRIRWEETEKGMHPMTPYAIVFGVTMTWATKLQALTDDLIANIKVH